MFKFFLECQRKRMRSPELLLSQNVSICADRLHISFQNSSGTQTAPSGLGPLQEDGSLNPVPSPMVLNKSFEVPIRQASIMNWHRDQAFWRVYRSATAASSMWPCLIMGSLLKLCPAYCIVHFSMIMGGGGGEKGD